MNYKGTFVQIDFILLSCSSLQEMKKVVFKFYGVISFSFIDFRAFSCMPCVCICLDLLTYELTKIFYNRKSQNNL